MISAGKSYLGPSFTVTSAWRPLTLATYTSDSATRMSTLESEVMPASFRIQTMAATQYGEIRANLWHRDMKPMHLLRTKLSFLGANRFDPRGDRWVRVTFFQGAPLIAELNSEPADLMTFDDWSYALAPTCPGTGEFELASGAGHESLL